MAVRDVSLLLLGCALVLVAVTAVTCLFAQAPSRHLFVWNGDDDRADSDFMAVLDLIPSGKPLRSRGRGRAGGRKGFTSTTPSMN